MIALQQASGSSAGAQDRLGGQGLGDRGAKLRARIGELEGQLAQAVQAAGLLREGPDNPLRVHAKGATWHPAQLRGACVCYFDAAGLLQARLACDTPQPGCIAHASTGAAAGPAFACDAMLWDALVARLLGTGLACKEQTFSVAEHEHLLASLPAARPRAALDPHAT